MLIVTEFLRILYLTVSTRVSNVMEISINFLISGLLYEFSFVNIKISVYVCIFIY